MSRKNTTLALAMVASTGLVFSTGAYATNGILPVGNSMIEQGMGGAGIANAAETLSGATNPALISSLGTQAGVGVIYFNPNRSANLGGGYVDSESTKFYIPSLGYVTGLGSGLSAGILVTALGGMNTDYPAKVFGFPAGFRNIGVDLRGYIIAPTVSYEVAPKTSIGASLLYGHAEFEAKGLDQIGFMPPGQSDVSDSANGYGVRLGVNSEVAKGVGVGAFVQPKMSMGKMDKFCNTLFAGTDCKITLPTMYGVGGNFAVSDGVKVLVDVVRADWGGVDLYGNTAPNGFGWKAQTILKAGAEFATTKDLTLRAGINYGKSPIPSDRVGNNVLFPAISEKHVTVGATYKFGNGLDLSGFVLKALNNEETDSTTGAKVKMDQIAVGIGLNWTMK